MTGSGMNIRTRGRSQQGDQIGLRRRQVDRLPAVRSVRRDHLQRADEMTMPEADVAADSQAGARRSAGAGSPTSCRLWSWRRSGRFASLFFPPFLFPSLVDVFKRCFDILASWSQFSDVLATVGRILAGLAGAFIVGAALAVLMVRSRAVNDFLSPILTLFQGIPALSWVVFAIIWFHGIEPRIFFIMVMTTLPAFTFQVLGALQAMSRDLMEMVMSFRPTRAEAVSRHDHPGDPAGHPHRLEGQSRQCLARGRRRRTGRRHRRRRLSNCCSSSKCSTWPARWPGRCSSSSSC